MEKLFLELLDRSITAGWIVLAAVLIRLLFRRSPKWVTGCLWILVAVRLVMPFSIESVYSLIPTAETVPYEILYSETPAIDTGVYGIDTVVNHSLESSVPNPGDSVNPLQVTAILSSYVWFAGMTALLASAAVSYILLKRKVRTAVRLRENIRQSEFIDTPFVLGIVRPTVYLPFSAEDADAEYIIAHEKAHIRRGDHLVKPTAFLLLSVYWFNPLMWLAYILLCRDIELACDERVIRNMSADERRSYSRILLEFSMKQKLITACPVAFGEVGVKTRVKSVLNYRKPAFWGIVLALAACVVCGVCLLTDPVRIDVLPEPQTVDRITMEQFRSEERVYASEISVLNDREAVEAVMQALNMATKTPVQSFRDRPYPEDLDGEEYYEIRMSLEDETIVPRVYLYSVNGRWCLEIPYDHKYRVSDTVADTVYAASRFTWEPGMELAQAVEEAERLDEIDAEMQAAWEQYRIEELAEQNAFYRQQLEDMQVQQSFERQLTENLMKKLAASDSAKYLLSEQSGEYHTKLFEKFRNSMRYSSKRHSLWYTFPDDSEVSNWNVTVFRLSADGTVTESIHCSGDPDYRYVPGGEYSSDIGEDTVAMKIYISVETADGLCTVEYDIRERFPQAFGQVPDTCESCTSLFAEIFESIYFGKGGIVEEPMVFFRLPNVPETADWNITLTSTDTSGKTETVLLCDGTEGFTADPGRWYSVSAEGDTSAVHLHIVSDCPDGPCEVTFDLMDWVN